MDLDYPRTFEIDTDLREQLLEQIRHDADFLARYNIMDYSLLVGVVKTGDGDTSASSKKKKKSKKHKSRSEEEITEVISPQPEKVPALEEIWRSSIQSRSEPSQERFVFGIIDILQEYNTFKKAAHVLKVILFRTIVRPYAKSSPGLLQMFCPFHDLTIPLWYSFLGWTIYCTCKVLRQ